LFLPLHEYLNNVYPYQSSYSLSLTLFLLGATILILHMNCRNLSVNKMNNNEPSPADGGGGRVEVAKEVPLP
jgi:hypothetical protein